jgi:hypothetical protein
MKKLVLFCVSLFLWAGMGFSQTVLYEDNLDSYAANSFLAVVNPTWWTTWSNNPGSGEDIQISTSFAHSTPNSGSADKIGGQTDAILKLGNKVSGKYEVTWYMYVETGKCGYYNFQHFESPGIEWAFEIYFRTGGAIELLEGGNTINGNYPKDAWFQCKHEIDLDADEIKFYLDGTLIHTWPFSNEASAPGGTLQLGGVDLFAGEASGSGEVAGFFIDDVYYAEIESGNNPVINVTPSSIFAWLVDGTTGIRDAMVSNTGTADLTYNVNIVYDLDAHKSATVLPNASGNSVKRTLSNISAAPSSGITPAPISDASAQLHYDGDNYTAVGWNTPPITITVAARFPNAMTLPYAGLDLTSVEVFVNDLNAPPASNLMTLKIYGMGNTYEPGPVLHQQTFTPMGGGWETITLTAPVKITGEDIWVGYQFTQTDAGIYIPGTDGGPANPNGDFLSSGVGWSHLSPGLDYNWNIRANLNGNVAPQWLTVAPMSGTVPPAGSDDLLLTFNAAGLAIGQYHATMKFLSNDPVTPVLDALVTLDVVGVGIDENEKLGIMVYPNPSKSKLNITVNSTLKNIVITDARGMVMYQGNSSSIDVSGFAQGVYFVKVETQKGTSNIKFIRN